MTDVVVPPVARPTYGIDTPNVLIGLAAVSLLALCVGFFMAAGRDPVMGIGPWIVAAAFALAAAWNAFGIVRHKPSLWRRALDDLELRGDESTLDLGCGRGLVLIETAKRVPQGEAHGIDIWRNRDQSGNRRITTELNARIEGVTERVHIRDGDVTRLPYDDRSFDLVTASFSIRSLALDSEREQAIDELVRVLKPGGRVLIVDNAHTGDLAERLRDAGLDTRHTARDLGFLPPAHTIIATA